MPTYNASIYLSDRNGQPLHNAWFWIDKSPAPTFFQSNIGLINFTITGLGNYETWFYAAGYEPLHQSMAIGTEIINVQLNPAGMPYPGGAWSPIPPSVGNDPISIPPGGTNPTPVQQWETHDTSLRFHSLFGYSIITKIAEISGRINNYFTTITGYEFLGMTGNGDTATFSWRKRL